MSASSKAALFWTPRILSIAFIGFLSLFALDVFGAGQGFWRTAQALFMHLIPVFVLVAALALAWRWEWVGAALYSAAGLLYVYMVLTMSRPIPPATRLLWIATISGPAFVIAALFLAGWLTRSRHPS